ncbi:hypothetical protein [Streptomyces sp. CB01881]|uniref:hypothetical protein n=1 Tax=Streptomyces sp. CB01881 TaxID=2078691 RepID=UPI000CDCBD3B|nr:hypothetical protein [Streptomyces sp. CB01881]AUY51413.1 hypothetical protein C2142_23565 [Streptomyces sp. CB01881]TYC74803.1 hypothetical protein EH183_23550 [Streptomyces sp. CB01881]
MPLRQPRPSAPAVVCALLLVAGCTTVGGSADRAGPGRELSAAELRAAAVADADLGPGYTVTVMTSGHGETGSGGAREVSGLPACQPLLDAVTPAVPPGAASASPGPGAPYAETDLGVARAADPQGGVYGGLLGYRAGRAAQLQAELEKLFGPCASFTSTAPPPVDKARKGVRTRYRLSREDAPTPGGADAVTGFTLTNESGSVMLSRRAVLVRVGPALAVFTTVGVGAEPATAPDERIVRQQVAKLRAAQAKR